MSFKAIRENKILTKITRFTVSQTSLNSLSTEYGPLITFANSLDQTELAKQYVGPYLGPNCLTF